MLCFLTLVTLGLVAAVPFKPVHVLALGFSLDAMYLLTWLAIRYRTPEWHSVLGWKQHLIAAGITLFAVALATVAYRQRLSRFRTRQRAARTSEEYQKAQYAC